MSDIDQKNSVFSRHNIFSSLNPSELSELACQTEIRHFNSGETIFSIGDVGNSMFLVISGTIAVTKIDDYQNSREIAKIITGDSLGEIDMITGSARTVTAIADTPSELLQFPSSLMTFPQFLETWPATGSKILYAFIQDIADRTREANELLKKNSPHIQELRRQIYEDKLTNLYNKTFLEENLPEWLKSKKEPISLLMIKPDNFKHINDSTGHEAGDKLLVLLANLLPSILPPESLLIRYLGNEFALVISDTDISEIITLAETIRHFYNTLDVTPLLKDEQFHLSVSIGIAVYPTHAQNASDLIESAHQLPLIGRGRGGNYILFPEDIAERNV